MIKKKTKSPKPKDAPLTEEEYDEMVSEESLRREQEGYFQHFNQFSKEELIQMLIEFQETEQKLYAWLMSEKKMGGLVAYGGGLASIKDELDRLRRERSLKVNNRRVGRQKQAVLDAATTDKAKALGVDDFYGLLCEAITVLEKNPQIKKAHPTEAKAIREIIVDLLFEPNRSRHTFDRNVWVGVVARNVKSNHIGTAKNSLKKKH
jgi:hypothetical protein